MDKNLNSIENFQGWESLATEEDFFADIPTEEENTEVQNVIQDVIQDDVIPEEGNTEVIKDQKPVEEDLFDTIEEEADVVTADDYQDEDVKEEVEVKSSSISVLDYLKDNDFFEFEDGELDNVTEESVNDILEDKFNNVIEGRIKELFEGLPDVVKQINKYAIDGGDLGTFFSSIAKNNQAQISDNLDIDEESNQELVMKEILRAEGNDDDYIETQIEFLKESGRLKMFAEKKFDKWKEDQKVERQNLLEQQEAYKKQQKELIRKAKEDVSSYVSKNDAIGSLTINKNDKRELPSYMNDKKVKLQNGTTISQMQKELFYDLPQNKEAFMQLAILMRNRNDDGTFNFESIAKSVETKVTDKVRENIRRNKQTIPTKSKMTKVNSKRQLADYFN